MPRIIFGGVCNEVVLSLLCASILLKLNKNIKLILNYVVGPIVFGLLVWSIYRQVQRQPDWQHSLTQIVAALRGASMWKLLAVVLLMFVNWGIEARKWQIVLKQLQHISFIRSFKAIFTGTTMAFFTPNRMGEYLGRVLYIEEGKRIQSVAVTIVCSMAQLIVTMIGGMVGLTFLKNWLEAQSTHQDTVFWMNILLTIVVAGCILLTLFYFQLSWLVKGLERISAIARFVRHIKLLDSFNATILLRILSLSVSRYLVFILQYYILFSVFGVDINWWQSFWAVSVVFLILAIVPTIAVLTELGVRWKASIELVQLFSNNAVGIMATSLAIWVINLVIPALVGSLLILRIKLFKQDKQQ
jgi:uncharacterized membrane protein YbhN (UPF0104 family)